MTVKVRFAPSPTGHIHIGNARTALFNWLFAKTRGGRFVLRLDDTDRERSREDYARAIEDDLAWLGLRPDQVVRQSERIALYEEAKARLIAAGRLYPCYETPEELERRRKRQMARGLPPVYDRAALSLSADERTALENEGRRPHWRFRLGEGRRGWADLVRGEQEVDLASLSDPVLVRADGSYLYTLPSVVDDIALGITHVVRGEDHVANTAAQIEIFEALGGSVPAFGHHNLLTGAGGEGLSKRLGSLSLSGLRARGFEPMAVANVAVLTGTSEPVEPHPDLEALGARFDLSRVSRAPARFDEADLAALNARVVHALPFSAVAARLAGLGVLGGAAFWDVVRANCRVVDEARGWWEVLTGEIDHAPDPADRDLLEAAARLLPPEPWDETTWKTWTRAVGEATGRKGKALFLPLRKALTGREDGPELARLLPLIGRERTSARLS